MLRGRFSDAAPWLDACLKRRPDDPVVWRARLRWARAADSLVEARRALVHLPAERFSPTELLTLRAWFAAREGRTDRERIALEQVIDQAPGDTQALERLAVLAGESRQSDRAAELRRRKARIDRATERYTRLLQHGDSVPQFADLAGLAEELGRGFEARGWWLLASQHQPSAAATAAVERLGPPRPDPHLPAGQTLAFHLGEVAGRPIEGSARSVGGRRPRRSRPGSRRIRPGPSTCQRSEMTRRLPGCPSSSITASRCSVSFPRPRPVESPCWTTTATVGSTSTSSRGVRFPPTPPNLRPVTVCSATAATVRSKTPPNDPASLG